MDSYQQDFRNKQGITVKEIVLEQYRKCCQEMSKEMTEGGVIRRLVGEDIIEFVAPNQIEIFINSVDGLKIILISHINKHKDIREKYIDKFENDLIELRKQHNLSIKEAKDLFFTKSTEFKKYHTLDYNDFLKEQERRTNLAKIRLYKELLTGLSVLIGDKLNYFEEMSLIDYVGR